MKTYEFTIKTSRGIFKFMKIKHEPMTPEAFEDIKAHYRERGHGEITSYRDVTVNPKPKGAVLRDRPIKKGKGT